MMDFNWVLFGLLLNVGVFFSFAWKKSFSGSFSSKSNENSLMSWAW